MPISKSEARKIASQMVAGIISNFLGRYEVEEEVKLHGGDSDDCVVLDNAIEELKSKILKWGATRSRRK